MGKTDHPIFMKVRFLEFIDLDFGRLIITLFGKNMTTQKDLVYLASHLVITRMNINVISLMKFTGPVHFYQCTVNAITEIT